jgi:hypothetical protein
MFDRRSRRIREQIRQHPNPRAGQPSTPVPFAEQMRQVYLKASVQPAVSSDSHTLLMRQLETRQKSRD